ncbi:MAG: hypothetical protein Pars2KO_00610 [Parasphingorhabdus sp.]
MIPRVKLMFAMKILIGKGYVDPYPISSYADQMSCVYHDKTCGGYDVIIKGLTPSRFTI